MIPKDQEGLVVGGGWELVEASLTHAIHQQLPTKKWCEQDFTHLKTDLEDHYFAGYSSLKQQILCWSGVFIENTLVNWNISEICTNVASVYQPSHETLQGPISLNCFSTAIQIWWIILFCSHLSFNGIATKFCTCHGSCAVVACAKICCDLMDNNWITARGSFHRIWIVSKKCQ